MKNRYKKFTILLFILVLLSIGVGYAFLQTNLNITGTTILKDNRWDIHLENVLVITENITAQTPTINSGRDTVSYSVTLNQPGDSYEFLVDAKNDGSIDGMISNISSKLNGVEITTLPPALSYSVTYLDDIAISNNHILEAGNKITYKIRVGYRTDINATDLPSTETSLNLSFTVTYVQADSNAITKPESASIYTTSGPNIMFKSPIPTGAVTHTNYNDAVTVSGYPFFLKHYLDGSNNVVYSHVGFVLNNQDYYIQGFGATYDETNHQWNYDSVYYEKNKTTLLSAFGSSNCTETDNNFIECTDSNITVWSSKNGFAAAEKVTWGCTIHDGYISDCGYL